MKIVDAYVDGGYRRDLGVGAFSAVLICNGIEKELVRPGAGTSNTMEMRAVLLALGELTEQCTVHIYTDSNYLHKGMTEWICNWRANAWRGARKKPVMNKELWQQLELATIKHVVHWHWVRGHAGNHYNERAHQLCCNLLDRLAFEKEQGTPFPAD